MYRFVICIDVLGDTLLEAYGQLRSRMNANDWESTDEVYDSDGEQVEYEELRAAIDAFYEMGVDPRRGEGHRNAREF